MSKYKRYLKSGHWKQLKKIAFKRDNYRCVKCHSDKSLVGHHIHYKKNLRDCTIDDIQTLCKNCHNYFHNKDSFNKKYKININNILCNFDAS